METKDFEKVSNVTGADIHAICWDEIVSHFWSEQTPREAATHIRKILGYLGYCILQFSVDDYCLLDTKDIQNSMYFANLLATAMERAEEFGNSPRSDYEIVKKNAKVKKG